MAAKNTGKKSIAGNIIWILVTGVILAIYIATHAMCFGKPKDVNEMLLEGDSPEEGDYVSINVDGVFDWYAETEYKINGFIPAGTKSIV